LTPTIGYHRFALALRSVIAPLTLFIALCAAANQSNAEDAWPGEEWIRATPAEVGMDAAAPERARDYALTGGGSGIVIRHGKLAIAWGDQRQQYDLKSTTKSIGVTALGLAILDGKLKLTDKAAAHHPTFGTPPKTNRESGWINEITIQHLATQTAGFDKPGGFTKLLFQPGTRWHYSDGGPNWLAECVTLAYQRDVADLMDERVFRPLGIGKDDLTWRKNAYRDAGINGIPRREFGSGIHANVDSMARLGYLYLRKGRWKNQQILPESFVEAAGKRVDGVVGLPEEIPPYGNASDHYGLLWWNNADGTLAGVPRDAYWSWGLYDSLIVVIPSLDLVAVRAGQSWKRTEEEHYAVLKPFLEPLVASVNAAKDAQSKPPVPPSEVIARLDWAPASSIVRRAKGGDNWPITWTDDDALYTAYGDGRGFEPFIDKKLSLGLSRITGDPENFRGENLRAPSIEQIGDGAKGMKASGLLMVDGALYLWARNAGNSQLACSTDHGRTWKWSDWKFTTSFGCPTFLNFGKNYGGARDDYVYVYSHDSDSAYEPADRMILARVPKDRILDRDAYQFFESLGPDNPPRWTNDIAKRGAVFTHLGRCYRSAVNYNAGLNRYLWCQIIPGKDTCFEGGFGVYEAPEPWGPWSSVFFTEKWDVGPGETASFPSKWMSQDGKTLHLVFSGDDSFSVRKATLQTFEDAKKQSSVPATERDYKAELPRIAPLEPRDAIVSFEVHPGFEIELVAAEPHVASPVALDFDENGRMFVVEMRDYSEQDKEALGQVRLLEDADGDGRYEKGTVFAKDLSWPTAVACANGGVFVGAAPHIYFLKDNDGDGRADIQEIVFTGFKRDNVQGLLNSFQWGFDNRLHGATSTGGGEIRRFDQQAKALSLRGRDFSIDTRSIELFPETGGGQHGMSFDDWGRKFVCANSDHIQLVLLKDEYLSRLTDLLSSRESIAADGPQAEVFRISPVEPWRELRTRLRVQGAVPGPIEGGGRAAGYFTGATGVTIYRGDAWPREYRGNAFIGDVGSNIVHRKVLEHSGVSLVARRADQNREFVASRDIWFRPVQFANAPDGNLFVIDMYREVIEHPASLPPVIKKHLDLTSGRDRGRIYRIKTKGSKPRPAPRLGNASLEELVSLLAHPNGWHRQTASRLLYERNDRAAVPLLITLIQTSASPLGRMHALYALSGIGELKAEHVLAAMRDGDAGVRRHAVKLGDIGQPSVQNALLAMADDDDVLVRFETAFLLGYLNEEVRLAALTKIARRGAGDRWMRTAIEASAPVELLEVLAADREFASTNGALALLANLARKLGRSPPDRQRLVRAIKASTGRDDSVSQTLLVAALEGVMKSAGKEKAVAEFSSHEVIAREYAAVIKRARLVSTDANESIADRVSAIRRLRLAPFPESQAEFRQLLEPTTPHEAQVAALEVLRELNDRAVSELLIESWPRMTPRLRAMAADVLFAREDSIRRLVAALEDGQVSIRDLDAGRLKALANARDPSIGERVARLGIKDSDSIAESLRKYASSLSAKGSAEKGRAVFRTVCAGCHRAENEGHELGPKLAALKNRGAEAILVNILDPNREVNPQFVNYVVTMTDGRTTSGLIAAESSTNIVLKRAEGITESIPRREIEEITSTGKSIMPDGHEKQIDPPAMADLIAYIMSLE
jgi:putative membrane-bound dehydrogenase-like protein